MQNSLLIVDPQNDFISGSMAVDGAVEAMDLLTSRLNSLPIDTIIVTIDCHPVGHCSFKDKGGDWPQHCLKYSYGAAIYDPLFQALLKWSEEGSQRAFLFLEKGTMIDKEEYSAFQSNYPDLFDKSETIYISGIAGNICVLNSIQDLAKQGLIEKIVVLTDVTPSLDDGTTLQETIKNFNLKAKRLQVYELV